MAKKQCVVRTYPYDYNNALRNLSEKLDTGWIVVLVSPIVDKVGIQCNDYILEKEIENQCQ